MFLSHQPESHQKLLKRNPIPMKFLLILFSAIRSNRRDWNEQNHKKKDVFRALRHSPTSRVIISRRICIKLFGFVFVNIIFRKSGSKRRDDDFLPSHIHFQKSKFWWENSKKNLFLRSRNFFNEILRYWIAKGSPKARLFVTSNWNSDICSRWKGRRLIRIP